MALTTLKRLPLVLSMAALVMSIGSLALVLSGCCPDGPTAATGEVFGQDFQQRGYSRASRFGDLVWTAGHLPESASPADDVSAQTESVMQALEQTLEDAGAGFDTVLMTNVYLTDFNDWDAFNSIYTRYFPDRLPPRVTVQIGRLGVGDIEISMVAHVRDE